MKFKAKRAMKKKAGPTCGIVHPSGSLYHSVIQGVFAWRSLLVFRMADRPVSLCVFCLWPVNIADGCEPQ